MLGVKVLILAGEELKANLLDSIGLAGLELYNEYGPSECTVWSTVKKIESKDEEPSIGNSISTALVYILDDDLKESPEGVCGEICIGGLGLARGYIGKGGLTAEKFIANPFVSEEDAKLRRNLRLYRSGDLGRYLPDGNIEYLGRKDDQVKIRGYRIELGEIEKVSEECSCVERSVVIIKEREGNKELWCYLVLKGGSVDEVRSYLSDHLAAYMLPSRYIILEDLPLTVNGKVDKAALPEISGAATSESSYEEGRNEVEKKLQEIWSEVLGIERVSINDNFFHIGGHSLLATQVVSRIRKHYKIDLSLKQLFENPTIRELEQRISKLMEQGIKLNILPLVKIVKRYNK